MIFVTVGSSHLPFDRLLRAVDRVELDEELVVQHGPSVVRPRSARCVDFLSFPEMTGHVRRARVVISHVGIGSVLVALAEGKRPLVVARRAHLRETTDDHQIETARRLQRAGLVTTIDEPLHLAALLAEAPRAVRTAAVDTPHLATELEAYIRSSVGRRTREAVT